MSINLKITVINNNKILKERTFSEAFSYRNLDNKSDLNEYENNVQSNLITKT